MVTTLACGLVAGSLAANIGSALDRKGSQTLSSACGRLHESLARSRELRAHRENAVRRGSLSLGASRAGRMAGCVAGNLPLGPGDAALAQIPRLAPPSGRRMVVSICHLAHLYCRPRFDAR